MDFIVPLGKGDSGGISSNGNDYKYLRAINLAING